MLTELVLTIFVNAFLKRKNKCLVLFLPFCYNAQGEGGRDLFYKVTFQRGRSKESGRTTMTPPRLSSAAASTPRRTTGQGGAPNWRPAPVQGLAMAEGQDLSDTQGGLAKSQWPPRDSPTMDK